MRGTRALAAIALALAPAAGLAACGEDHSARAVGAVAAPASATAIQTQMVKVVIGFAIPSNSVKSIATSLIQSGR